MIPPPFLQPPPHFGRSWSLPTCNVLGMCFLFDRAKQTCKMLQVTIIPIVALLTLTMIWLVTSLNTYREANDAEKQTRLIMQVCMEGAGMKECVTASIDISS